MAAKQRFIVFERWKSVGDSGASSLSLRDLDDTEIENLNRSPEHVTPRFVARFDEDKPPVLFTDGRLVFSNGRSVQLNEVLISQEGRRPSEVPNPQVGVGAKRPAKPGPSQRESSFLEHLGALLSARIDSEEVGDYIERFGLLTAETPIWLRRWYVLRATASVLINALRLVVGDLLGSKRSA